MKRQPYPELRPLFAPVRAAQAALKRSSSLAARLGAHFQGLAALTETDVILQMDAIRESLKTARSSVGDIKNQFDELGPHRSVQLLKKPGAKYPVYLQRILENIEARCYSIELALNLRPTQLVTLATGLERSAKPLSLVAARCLPNATLRPKPILREKEHRHIQVCICTHKFQRPIPLVEAVRITGEHHYCLTRKLRQAAFPIGGTRRHYVAELEHIIVCEPTHAALLMEWALLKG